MNETTMPATEAAVDTTEEVVNYELAFHVLPTVAEGEVAAVEQSITTLITGDGGVIGVSEAAQRFDLAYELTKHIDGKYRHFTSAYFGWLRFTATPAAVATILQEVEAMPEILRVLIVRLARQEEAHPFYLHEALAARTRTTDDGTDTAHSDQTKDTDTSAHAAKPVDNDTTETTDATATSSPETTADATTTETAESTTAAAESKK